MNIRFKQVDAFTRVRYKGNPVAVVMEASSLTTEQMQQIAKWTNLSETTFVLPPNNPTADYRVRMFTPNAELPFAGHPTIGTAHALLEAGYIKPKNGQLFQESDVGLVKLAVQKDQKGEQWISFELPKAKFSDLDKDALLEVNHILKAPLAGELDPVMVDTGPKWVVAQLPSARAVLNASPDLERLKILSVKHDAVGLIIFGPHEPGAPTTIELRAFAPAHGIPEDPVCGAGNGSAGAVILRSKQTGRFGTKYLSSQGSAIGRSGIIQIELIGDDVHVGGNAVTCIDGNLSL